MLNSESTDENPNPRGYHYILHIKEHLASNWSEAFEGLTVAYTSTGETLLTGFIPDQAALHGLLARIRDLNLTLISVNRLASDNPHEGGSVNNNPTVNWEK